MGVCLSSVRKSHVLPTSYNFCNSACTITSSPYLKNHPGLPHPTSARRIQASAPPCPDSLTILPRPSPQLNQTAQSLLKQRLKWQAQNRALKEKNASEFRSFFVPGTIEDNPFSTAGGASTFAAVAVRGWLANISFMRRCISPLSSQ